MDVDRLSPGDLSTPMWNQICRMPFSHLEETTEFKYIEKVMSLCAQYSFSQSDSHMTDPNCTICLAKLLKLVCEKCTIKVHEFGITEQSLQAKIAVQNKEIIRLQQDVEDRRQLDQTDNRSRIIEHTIEGDRLDIQKLKIENDKLHAELRKVTKLNEHLSESQDARHNYRIQADADEEKFRLEYKHLVSRFGRLQERLRKTEADLEEMRKRELETRVSGSDELDRLRQKVEALVEDNYKLVESRDYAEDQCERREAKALHDLTELQRLTESLLSDKDHKYENMKEECNKTIQSLKYRIEELMNSHEQSLQEREEEITHLRIQYEKLQAVSKKRFEFSSSSSASSVTSQTATVTTSRRNAGATSEQQLRLERENDDLIAEVEQFELRIDALEEENQRLNRLVKDYERGNDGLLHLRQELSDASRRVENLQTENQQLRERLNNMEDSLTFTTALQELCKKVGVTDDEINSLRPHNTAAFSEIDTLKEEVNTLKEEVEWLEKERRHWMDKVRLQPLMDTKLRFELGLTSEQLKQLDDLVDQMKCGSLIVEDEENTNYKEKYFLELQARRKDAEQFNEYVRGRIDESLRSAFMGLDIPNMNAALDSIKEHIDVISTLGPTGLQIGNTQMQDQLDSVTHRLEQANITIADREETIVRLREDLAGSTAARDAIAKERDQYRETLFSSAGFAAQADDDDVNEDDMTESLRLPRGNSKWRALFSTLRDQLDAKDSIISTLGKQMNELRDKIKDQQKVIESAELRIEAEQQEEASLHDKIAVLSELNEELGEKNSSLKRINLDLEESVKRFESSGVSNDVQKIVLLRRREAKLMQRLRRALTAKDKSSTAEESMRNSMGTVFASLKEALEGTSTGFVLPPATCRTSEEDMLVFLQQSVSNLLSGKLFREDSRYLLQLQHIYHNLEQQEELNEFRVNSRNRDNEIKSLQHELDERTAEVEQLAAFKNKLSDTQGRDEDIDYHRAASARWQSEAISWKKKCELFTARLELKEKEVSALERDVDCSRMEIVGMKEQVENLLRMSGESSSVGISTERREGTQVSDGAPHTPVSVSRLEREVARLKSINLGLLQYSVELQSSIKGLEIDLETKSQEVTLLKESGGSPVVSDFISGAIREHAALRRQGELALIQNRRLRIQLAATEANYQVVSNEANSYRHSAYRLYRRYVSDTLSMVDYFRHVQRESKGSLPPHRVDIMHRRFHRVLSALHTSTARSTALSADVAEKASFITSLEQQIGMMQLDASGDISDAMESQLREANVKMRQSCRQLTELEEDCKYAQSKSVRLEKHIELLNEEITRLEFGVMKVSNTEDDSIVARLIALKDEVFTKAEAPSVTPQPLTLRAAYQSGDDGDVAIREYKAVAMRLDECVRECARLKQDADQQRAETRKKDGINEELRLEVQRLEQSISAGQRQLEEERQKFELREQRLSSTHQIQSDVARRASEQNAQSLSDLLRKKDETIAQLQEQLRVERQKALSYQLEESARMERLHEHMFRDNSAVVERFRVAIEGIGENIPDGSAVHTAGANQDSPMTEQLRHLTAETIRLTKELKDARTTNIILESQLSSQLEKSQIQLHLINTSPSTTAGSPPQAVVPSNTDAVMSLARSQSTMIESIRKREAALTDELHRERELRISLQGQLEAAQIRHVEQGGSLQLLSQVSRSSESPLVAELRAQTAFLEQELHNTRELLETERAAAQRLKGDAEDWQSNLTALQSEVTGQRAEVERAKHLASLNEALQGDVRALQEQNEKLILASTVLKQKLMEEARRGGDSSRQHQQELALAQRMGAIQSESVAQMKVLDVRMKAIQAELNDRVIKESDMLQKNEEAQRMIYQLHLQIRSKDREIVELKSKKGIPTPGVTASASAPGAPPAAAAMTVQKGTQAHTAAVPTTAPVEAPTVVAAAQDSGNVTEGAISSAERAPASTKRGPPVAPEVVAPEVLLQPQLAGLVNREVQRQQRDQLQQISTLRGTANRLEKDLSEVRDHLANERQTSRSLRVRIQELQAQKEESEAEHSRELVRLHRIKLQSGDKSVSHPSTRVETSVPAPAVSSSVVTPHPASVSSAIPAPVLPVGSMVHSVPIVEGDVQKLRERVVELEASAASAEMYKQQVEVLRRQQLPGGFVPFLPPASTAQVPPVSPEVKQWLSEGSHTEEVIHDLRHKLEVEAPRVLREMEVKFHHQERLADRLFSELAKVKSSTTEEVREEFGGVAGVTPVERSLEELETELLHKTSEVCALRFSAESSALKVSRLRQQLEGLQQLDEAHTRKLRSNHNEMEMLETLVSNLKLLMSRLQKENMELREQVPHREHYAELLAQARSWQEKERELKSMIERLSAQCASAGIEQHQQWQRALAAAQAEVQRYKTELLELRQRVSLQIPTSSPSASMLYRRVTPLEEAEAVPPPLPPAPFTSSNRSTASPDTQPQRRLSSRDPGGSNPALNSADYHASRLGRRS